MARPSFVAGGAANASGFQINTATISLAVGTGTNRVCFAMFGSNAAGADPASATFDGNAMTLVQGVFVLQSRRMALYYYAIPDGVTGTKNIIGTMSSGDTRPGIAVGIWQDAAATPRYSGVTTAADGSLTTSHSLTVTSDATNGLAVVFGFNDVSLATTASGGTTKQVTETPTFTNEWVMEKAGAGSTTLNWTTGSNDVSSRIGFSIDGAASAPTIDTQPTAQSVTEPAAATFTASVSGTYTGLRWQRQAAGAGAWADVSGATSTTLTTGATSVSGGSWNSTDRVRLQVDWSGGTVTSTDVALTVSAGGTAPAITVQPSNTSVTVGSTANFSVTATGSGTLTYQWERQPAAGGGYSAISGATSSSYTTPVTTISGGSANLGDTYRCVVTGDTSPPATSSAATLTVLYPVATTVSLTLYGADGTTPAASLTNLKWAFWDRITPDLIAEAPVAKGAVETTDGSGVLTISITGTALRVGDIGYLIVTNSDGTTSQGAALKAFAAPVVVS